MNLQYLVAIHNIIVSRASCNVSHGYAQITCMHEFTVYQLLHLVCTSAVPVMPGETNGRLIHLFMPHSDSIVGCVGQWFAKQYVMLSIPIYIYTVYSINRNNCHGIF